MTAAPALKAPITYVVTFVDGRIGRSHDNPPQRFAIAATDPANALAAAIYDHARPRLASREAWVDLEIDPITGIGPVGEGTVFVGYGRPGARFTIAIPGQRAEKGDIFGTEDDAVARVIRASKSGTWVDIVVIQGSGPDMAVWSKRMPAGIPPAWSRLPRR